MSKPNYTRGISDYSEKWEMDNAVVTVGEVMFDNAEVDVIFSKADERPSREKQYYGFIDTASKVSGIDLVGEVENPDPVDIVFETDELTITVEDAYLRESNRVTFDFTGQGFRIDDGDEVREL